MSRQSVRAAIGSILSIVILSACGSATEPTSTASPTPEAASADPATAEPTPSPTPNNDEATLSAPDELEAGAAFDVAWTGPNSQGDYIAIVPADATGWTETDDYFNTNSGSPSSLTAPLAPGPYEVVYFDGASEAAVTRVPIEVTAFAGDLLAPEEVPAGAVFAVAWNGPNGPGDYVTIQAVGAGAWTDEDYFSTSSGSPGELVAPITSGQYEIRYVSGTGGAVQATRPITVLALEASISAPDQVTAGETFDVEWTGPDGPGDYVTIVPLGAEPRTYLSYFGTSSGSPGTLTAPDEPGDYELWYVTAAEYGIFARTAIEVRP